MAGLTYSDTTGKLGLVQDCEFNLNLGDAGISGDASSQALLKVFTRLMNSWYQKIVTMIFASQDEWSWDDVNQTNFPIATTNLIANQQDYSLPIALNALRIQRVDVSYDSGATWHRSNAFNKGESLQPLDATSVKNNYTASSPFYSVEYNSIFLYPIPTANSTAGLKIWFQRGPLEFVSTDTTKAPGIDFAFHRMISVGASYDFAVIKNLPQKDYLGQLLADYEKRLKEYYGKKNDDRAWVLGSIYNDTYGN